MSILPVRGQVFDFLDDNQIFAAVCMDERKGKPRALTESGREVNATPKQIVHLHDFHLDTSLARETLTRALQTRAACREVLVMEVDIPGLWEVLKDEAGDFTASELAELVFGEASDDQIAAVLCSLYRERVHFRSRGGGFRPTDDATVAAIFTQRAREDAKSTHAQRITKWLRAVWNGQASPLPSEAQEIIEMLKDVALNGDEAHHREPLGEILRAAGLDEDDTPFQLLVRLGEWSPDENLMLLRLDTRRVFPTEVQTAALHLAQAGHWPWEHHQREDLTGLTVYTVDSATTRDVDDGLSLTSVPGGFEVGIHITDVAAMIPRDSCLDNEARLRGTSIYLVDLRIPMLPAMISEELCSLKEGALRPAISLFVTVDAAGEVQSRRFSFTLIRATRCTYQEVDHALISDEISLWHTLLNIAQAWRAARWARGALFLTFPEITVLLGENGQIEVEREDRETGAQIVVSEMMIQANRLSATMLREAEIPTLYRGQVAPRERIFEGAVPEDLWLNYRQRMQLSRAETGVTPTIHHGLGVEAYATISSPLRRYADLVNQRQLTACLRGGPLPYSAGELMALLTTIERPLSQVSVLEQNRRRYWLLRLLEQQRGLETAALVIGIYGQRIQIVLSKFMLETGLSAAAHPDLQPGQWLQVRIVRARALVDLLRVEVISLKI